MLTDPKYYEIDYSREDYKTVELATSVFAQIDTDASSWNKFINGDDLKVWFQKPEGKGGMCKFYFEKLINAPM